MKAILYAGVILRTYSRSDGAGAVACGDSVGPGVVDSADPGAVDSAGLGVFDSERTKVAGRSRDDCEERRGRVRRGVARLEKKRWLACLRGNL